LKYNLEARCLDESRDFAREFLSFSLGDKREGDFKALSPYNNSYQIIYKIEIFPYFYPINKN
jgi:hypothetical protein